MADIEYVKNLRNTHCVNCRDNTIIHGKHLCDNRAVINCWLRKTYLPDGIYSKASEADCISSMTIKVADEIDKKILKQILK